MPHSYIKWTLNVNSSILNDFYKTCEYLHNSHRQNCFYNKSSAFRYIINLFNENMKNQNISKSDLLKYHSRTKKDKEIGISVLDYEYRPFFQNCNQLKIHRNDMIRILMVKLIEDNKLFFIIDL